MYSNHSGTVSELVRMFAVGDLARGRPLWDLIDDCDGRDWRGVLLLEPDGKPFLLERTRVGDGYETSAAPLTWKRWEEIGQILLSNKVNNPGEERYRGALEEFARSTKLYGGWMAERDDGLTAEDALEQMKAIDEASGVRGTMGMN